MLATGFVIGVVNGVGGERGEGGDMTDDQRGQLIKLAGEMVRGVGMPSPEVEDWELPKTTSAKTRRTIRTAAMTANKQAVRWAAAIADIVNRDRGEATA